MRRLATRSMPSALRMGLDFRCLAASFLRCLGSAEKTPLPFIKTDAATSPGSAGGGLFDQQGELIGITTSKALGAGAGGFSFSTPVEWVTELTKTVEAPETRLAESRVLYRQAQNALAESRSRASIAQEALSAEQIVSRQAREQVSLLNLQIAALRQQLARIEAALEVSEREAKEKGVQIVNLSQRLNAALASKVQELASFRSEFFGRLRKALGNRSDVRIVGDRFVFQSEVLFPSGAATLQPEGRELVDKLAQTIKELSGQDSHRHQLGAAGRRPHRPDTDLNPCLPVELGALHRAALSRWSST